tara:strand:- start:7529 stop:8710 length:1182 start_codon:yes stop_codon:yes gene_type:complete
MATYDNDLRLKEIATGDESGGWGTSTNTNLSLIADAFGFGSEAITTNADTHTTTIADFSADAGRSLYLKYTGTLDSACTITLGPNTVSKVWIIENATSGSQNIIIKQGSGATVTIAADAVKVVYSDGAGSGASVVDAFQDVALGGTPSATNMTITSSLTADALIASTSLKTPLIEFTDGDNAIAIADGGGVEIATSLDMNGKELILDADADTSITADVDDQIDFKVGGTDQIQLNDGYLAPVTDSDVDLGTTSLAYKNAYIDSLGLGTNASGTVGEIRASNNITAYYSSDIGLKENLNPIENSIEKIQAISGYNFDWKDEVVKERGGEDDYFVRKSDVGVVAQEIEAILPEACATRPDGTKAVRYEQLVPLLIEGIKELKAEIENIKDATRNK